jgi:hypothetical protein
MKPFIVTKLKKAEAALIGMPVPKEKNGNIGKLVEHVMAANDYEMSSGIGPDIPKLNVEVKTKGKQSGSAYKVGTMTLDDIKKYTYDQSPLKDKMQILFIVSHCQVYMKITDAKVYHFYKESIQEKLRESYNSARDLILAGDTSSYIRGKDSWGYFEWQNSKSWQFRIPVKHMKSLKGMARSVEETLFY